MAQVVIPDPRVEAPELFYPGRMPVHRVGLNVDHPAAKGMVRAACFGGTQFMELVRKVPLRFGDVSAADPELGAFGLLFPSAGTVEYMEFDTPIPSLSEFTILTRFRRLTTSVEMALISDKEAANWSATNGVHAAIRSDGGVQFKVGDSLTDSTTDVNNDTDWHDYRFLFADGVTQDVFVNGTEVTYNTHAIAANYSESAQDAKLGAGNTLTAATSAHGWMAFCYLYDRLVDDEQAQSIFHHPCQMLVPL